MKTSRILLSNALSVVGLAIAGHAVATTTHAEAHAFVSGNTVTQSVTAGAEGAQASAAQDVPSPYGDVFVSAQASSAPGTLSAVGVARTTGAPGGFQGSASASWADAFAINAAGHGPSETGTFSGSIDVSGELLTEFAGRVYADTQVYAIVDIFPGTGDNGGRTVVSGSARNLIGYDIPGTHTGSEIFTLVFTGVPFTFGRLIDVSMGLAVLADINAIDAGATGRATADYGHTMRWYGITEVLDSSGGRIDNYSAVSPDSGFNFAPVPEPGSWALAVAGLFVVGWRMRRTANSPTRRN